MRIIKLVSQPSKKVKGIDAHFICMNSSPADKIPKNESMHSYLEIILNIVF